MRIIIMKTYTYKTRVRYAEVDQMGVVYYANYLAYLESGRTGLMREMGISYGEIERRGFFLPVVECRCKYRGVARFDEEIAVETTLDFIKNASIKFDYTVKNHCGDTIVTGYTVHPFVNTDWKIVAIPDDVKSKLTAYVNKENED
jgi:acyl-CoA thioester hydrolase